MTTFPLLAPPSIRHTRRGHTASGCRAELLAGRRGGGGRRGTGGLRAGERGRGPAAHPREARQVRAGAAPAQRRTAGRTSERGRHRQGAVGGVACRAPEPTWGARGRGDCGVAGKAALLFGGGGVRRDTAQSALGAGGDCHVFSDGGADADAKRGSRRLATAGPRWPHRGRTGRARSCTPREHCLSERGHGAPTAREPPRPNLPVSQLDRAPGVCGFALCATVCAARV